MIGPNIRNIAIVAHVDHGKTTLIDQLLKQSGTLEQNQSKQTRIMDSNELEKERGITILSKNTAIHWKNYKINLIDTPGHADFGGEVERILSMVDAVLIVVDAVDGPMPQTKFVTEKAFQKDLKPIVVINKIDRPAARCDAVIDEIFDLFDKLEATDEQLDFPIIYASALQGFATLDWRQASDDVTVLLDGILKYTPAPPPVDYKAPFQMQISSLNYTSFLGLIGIGRIVKGQVKVGQMIILINKTGQIRHVKIGQLFCYHGLKRVAIQEASAGDIVAVSGIENLSISDTLCSKNFPEALPSLTVDKPTLSMIFQVNDSPFAGQDGKFITSGQLRTRLWRESLHNIALKVEETDNPDKFKVSGRGELHLGILVETLRREGYELAISRPQVILKTKEDGSILEPYEYLVIEISANHQGAVMQAIGERKGLLQNITHFENNVLRLEFEILARGLVGFHTEFMTMTSGSGQISHRFNHYGTQQDMNTHHRKNGVLIANQAGVTTAYALWNLQVRGRLIVKSQTKVYSGMIIGIHNQENDLVVNVIRSKQLTNVRASGSDENITLTPPIQLNIEKAMETINDDELVEITPNHIRLRKKYLKEHERKHAQR